MKNHKLGIVGISGRGKSVLWAIACGWNQNYRAQNYRGNREEFRLEGERKNISKKGETGNILGLTPIPEMSLENRKNIQTIRERIQSTWKTIKRYFWSSPCEVPEVTEEMMENLGKQLHLLNEGYRDLENQLWPTSTSSQTFLSFDFSYGNENENIDSVDYQGGLVDPRNPVANRKEQARIYNFLSQCDVLLFVVDAPSIPGLLEGDQKNQEEAFATALGLIRKIHPLKNVSCGIVVTKSDLIPGFDQHIQFVSEKYNKEVWTRRASQEAYQVFQGKDVVLGLPYHLLLESRTREYFDKNSKYYNPSWGRAVEKVLEAFERTIVGLRSTTLNLEVFFVSATGGVEQKVEKDEKGNCLGIETVPISPITPKGVIPLFSTVFQWFKEKKYVDRCQNILRAVKLAAVILIVFTIFGIYYAYHHEMLKQKISNAENENIETIKKFSEKVLPLHSRQAHRIFCQAEVYRILRLLQLESLKDFWQQYQIHLNKVKRLKEEKYSPFFQKLVFQYKIQAMIILQKKLISRDLAEENWDNPQTIFLLSLERLKKLREELDSQKIPNLAKTQYEKLSQEYVSFGLEKNIRSENFLNVRRYFPPKIQKEAKAFLQEQAKANLDKKIKENLEHLPPAWNDPQKMDIYAEKFCAIFVEKAPVLQKYGIRLEDYKKQRWQELQMFQVKKIKNWDKFLKSLSILRKKTEKPFSFVIILASKILLEKIQRLEKKTIDLGTIEEYLDEYKRMRKVFKTFLAMEENQKLKNCEASLKKISTKICDLFCTTKDKLSDLRKENDLKNFKKEIEEKIQKLRDLKKRNIHCLSKNILFPKDQKDLDKNKGKIINLIAWLEKKKNKVEKEIQASDYIAINISRWRRPLKNSNALQDIKERFQESIAQIIQKNIKEVTAKKIISHSMEKYHELWKRAIDSFLRKFPKIDEYKKLEKFFIDYSLYLGDKSPKELSTNLRGCWKKNNTPGLGRIFPNPRKIEDERGKILSIHKILSTNKNIYKDTPLCYQSLQNVLYTRTRQKDFSVSNKIRDIIFFYYIQKQSLHIKKMNPKSAEKAIEVRLKGLNFNLVEDTSIRKFCRKLYSKTKIEVEQREKARAERLKVQEKKKKEQELKRALSKLKNSFDSIKAISNRMIKKEMTDDISEDYKEISKKIKEFEKYKSQIGNKCAINTNFINCIEQWKIFHAKYKKFSRQCQIRLDVESKVKPVGFSGIFFRIQLGNQKKENLIAAKKYHIESETFVPSSFKKIELKLKYQDSRKNTLHLQIKNTWRLIFSGTLSSETYEKIAREMVIRRTIHYTLTIVQK